MVDFLIANSLFGSVYFEDLDYNGTKEIIITSSTNILIYNYDNTEPVWSSPTLTNPVDLKFADLDVSNDNAKEIFFISGPHLYIFNLFSDSLIWQSPDLSLFGVYQNYDIGDRDSDGDLDMAFIFTDNPDTVENFDLVWVYTFDGPDFSSTYYINFLIANEIQSDYSVIEQIDGIHLCKSY